MVSSNLTSFVGGRGARPRDQQAAGFDELVGLVARRMHAPVGILVLPDLARPGQISIATHGLPNPETDAETRTFGTQLHDLIRRSLRPLILSDSRMQSDFGALPLVRSSRCLAFLGVPVLDSQSRMIGALCLAHHEPHHWSEADLDALRDFATIVGREMRQRRLTTDQSGEISMLRQRLERERLHNFQREAIFQAMATPGLPAAARFRAVLNAGCAALRADYGVLTRISGNRAQIVAASKNAPTDKLKAEIAVGETYTGEILLQDRQICQPDTALGDEPLRRDLFGRAPEAFFGAPITSNGLPFGTIEFSTCTLKTRRIDPSLGSVLSMMAISINGYLCARQDPTPEDTPDDTPDAPRAGQQPGH
ncbi:GAF domain-containing protein [Marinibacterium sp. SX1]|uniref:GAF domain-containing protein n=1 Tax=Marinibacterium sp. SX1 TaxID=3388424 RepID=UPI003D17CC7E